MDARARRARRLLLLTLLIAQGPPTAAAIGHQPPWEPPRRVTIDLEHDPAWRLRLLPGIGPARARRILEIRAAPAASDAPLLVRALGPRLAARIATTPLVEFRGNQ